VGKPYWINRSGEHIDATNLAQKVWQKLIVETSLIACLTGLVQINI
jgi:hypothetical protein